MGKRLMAAAIGLTVAIPTVGVAQAERELLTIEEVLALARSRAPRVELARTEVEAARAELAGARVLSPNPTIEGGAGRRWGDERSIDVEVGLSVPLELWGQRTARIDRAERGIEQAAHQVDDARRLATGAALGAFFEVVHRQAVLALAQERRRLAGELLQAASERRRVGDVSDFEVNLARAEVARAESAVAAARGAVVRERADVYQVLGLEADAEVEVSGDLGERGFLPAGAAAVEDRPDVAAARAARRRADASVRLADKARLPALSVRGSYAREEGADIAFGGLALTVPIFDHGQGQRRRARAERRRAELLLEYSTRRAAVELAAARDAYQAATRALADIEAEAAPLAIENESLARAAYAAGKLDLAALLVVRREALDTRREHLDRALAAALAAVDLWVALGAPAVVQPNPNPNQGSDR